MAKKYSWDELTLIVLDAIQEAKANAEDLSYIPLNPYEVSNNIDVPPETISSIVNKLEEKGVVKITGYSPGFLLSINDDVFDALYSKLQTQLSLKNSKVVSSNVKNDEETDSQVLSCGSIEVDISQATIKYRNNPTLDLALGNQNIKLLIYLLKNKRVVEYRELAQYLELNSYHQGVTNVDMGRDVQFVKNKLMSFLKKQLCMDNREAENLIVTIDGLGYKINYAN